MSTLSRYMSYKYAAPLRYYNFTRFNLKELVIKKMFDNLFNFSNNRYTLHNTFTRLNYPSILCLSSEQRLRQFAMKTNIDYLRTVYSHACILTKSDDLKNSDTNDDTIKSYNFIIVTSSV